MSFTGYFLNESGSKNFLHHQAQNICTEKYNVSTVGHKNVFAIMIICNK